jgi:hypothetical protein
MLEIAIQFILVEVLNPDNRAGKADVFRVGAAQAPLTKQITCIPSLLTGNKEVRGKN